MQKVVGIFVFDDIEVLDFCGPFEVLSVTRVDESKRLETLSPFDVKLVSITKDIVLTTGGMKVVPDFDFETCPELDILIVPGGMGTRKLMYDERVLEFVNKKAKEVELLTSVCTGSLILASAKLLDGVNDAVQFVAHSSLMLLAIPDTLDAASNSSKYVVFAVRGTVTVPPEILAASILVAEPPSTAIVAVLKNK